jgi:protein ImuB
MFAAIHAPALPAAALLDVARAFTPRFEQLGSAHGHTVVLLDASGLSRLFGTAQELGEHLRDALQKYATGNVTSGDPVPRVALASTQTAATLLALGSPGLTVVMPGKEAIALAPLGVSVLDQYEKVLGCLDAVEHPSTRAPEHLGKHPRMTHEASRPKRRAPENRMLEILTKWGIRSLGALTALSGPEIHERFGERGALWQTLARGSDIRPMVPWVDEVPFEAALELEWPIEGLEPLSFVLARLLEPLAERLERADRGAAVIYTSLRLTSRSVFTRTLQLPAPMRDPKTLRTLILLDLESHPPDAPIDIVRVLVEPTPARVLQWTLLERAQPAAEQVSTLVARLTALMGQKHVGSAVLVDTWKPGAFEMSDFRCEIADQSKKLDRSIEKQSANRQSAIDQQSEISDLKSSAALKSALRRFRFPVPTRVVVAEGRPVRVQTDRQGFTSGAIVEAAGPWRTSGNWWNTSAFAREQSGELRRDLAEAASGREGGPSPRMKSGQPANGPTGQQVAWDRDEWDVAMTDGTVYRLVVEREVGQWFLEGVID